MEAKILFHRQQNSTQSTQCGTIFNFWSVNPPSPQIFDDGYIFIKGAEDPPPTQRASLIHSYESGCMECHQRIYPEAMWRSHWKENPLDLLNSNMYIDRTWWKCRTLPLAILVWFFGGFFRRRGVNYVTFKSHATKKCRTFFFPPIGDGSKDFESSPSPLRQEHTMR